MTEHDVAAIVRGLTTTQVTALRNARHPGFGFHPKTLEHGGRSSTGTALFARGLVKHTGILSPLGHAVRAHILSQRTSA